VVSTLNEFFIARFSAAAIFKVSEGVTRALLWWWWWRREEEDASLVLLLYWFEIFLLRGSSKEGVGAKVI
jgi:hypothetical protein